MCLGHRRVKEADGRKPDNPPYIRCPTVSLTVPPWSSAQVKADINPPNNPLTHCLTLASITLIIIFQMETYLERENYVFHRKGSLGCQMTNQKQAAMSTS